MTPVSNTSKTPVRKKPTRRCIGPAGQGMHDFVRTDEVHEVTPHPSGDIISHVWVCSKCGERISWW